MGGGYIQCGDFTGDDKSCSAISGVFEELPNQLASTERDSFIRDVLTPIELQLEDETGLIKISPDISQQLLPAVNALFEKYKLRFADADVWDVIELQDTEEASATDLKWGKGPGWRYYCLTDLRTALQHAIDHDAEVLIHFD